MKPTILPNFRIRQDFSRAFPETPVSRGRRAWISRCSRLCDVVPTHCRPFLFLVFFLWHKMMYFSKLKTRFVDDLVLNQEPGFPLFLLAVCPFSALFSQEVQTGLPWRPWRPWMTMGYHMERPRSMKLCVQKPWASTPHSILHVLHCTFSSNKTAPFCWNTKVL